MYIYPHKKEWKNEYINESNLILLSYGDDIELYHIGSTAIEGLVSKDCIDILGIVENLFEVPKRKKSIIDLGYCYKGEYGISGRQYFSKTIRKVHLHIFEENDPNIKKHLYFIDIMRDNDKLIKELNNLKNHLHLKHPTDKDSYQREKQYFYEQLHAMQLQTSD